MILVEKNRKRTKNRTPQIAHDKKPIQHDAYYTIREITDKTSPYWLCSAYLVFKALREGALKADYLNRKVLLKGSSIHAWIQGRSVS
ncbi:MAG: hypothetical protein L0226_15935 [Acidobacteria bacterium]|nr:hypothetical protein [Acidobacteriota bacterium]